MINSSRGSLRTRLPHRISGNQNTVLRILYKYHRHTWGAHHIVDWSSFAFWEAWGPREPVGRHETLYASTVLGGWYETSLGHGTLPVFVLPLKTRGGGLIEY